MPRAPMRKDWSFPATGSSTTNADGSRVRVTVTDSMADLTVMREDINFNNIGLIDDKQLEVLRLRNGRKTCPSSIMQSDISSADDDNDDRNASFNDLQYAAFLDVQKERWPKRATDLPSITQKSDVVPTYKPQERRHFRPLLRLPTKESQGTKTGKLRGRGMPADRASGYRRSSTNNIADFDSARGFQLADPL